MEDGTLLVLRDNVGESRYEAEVEGMLAICTYERNGQTFAFNHVLVPPVIEGRGIGTQLVRFGLDDVRAQGAVVIPRCPFVLAVIRNFPEYFDIVAPSFQRLVARPTNGGT
jgi:predicted GNAT family acetyltransferase